MKGRNIYALCLASALVAAGLTGCGADSGQTADVAADSAQSTAQKSEKEADNGEVHLRIWAGEEDKDLIATIADNFIAEHAECTGCLYDYRRRYPDDRCGWRCFGGAESG